MYLLKAVKYLSLAALIILGAACSIYKTTARKNLESIGPPTGSIKTSSVKMMLLSSSQMNLRNSDSIQVCEISANDCAKYFACIENSDDEFFALGQTFGEQTVTQVDSTSLYNIQDSSTKFEHPLVCNEL